MTTTPETRYATDGHTRPLTKDDLVKGLVIRRYESDGALVAFSDTIIVAFEATKDGILVKLARPYIYPSEFDSSPLMGFESYSVTADRLIEHYHVVLHSTGKTAVQRPH